MSTTVTATVTSFITTAVSSSPATPSSTGAPHQAGVLEGGSPVTWAPTNPIQLFIVQAVIVIVLCQLLTYPLRYLQQPRVIAEVIGGIILGPTVMMRIPGFRETIFPAESMPVFNNMANFGLLVFLFVLDIRLFTNNVKVAVIVGLAGMTLPFGMGYAIAVGLYERFHQTDPDAMPIEFPVYGLFIGTALAITAFPVLCRILTELKLLGSNVGVTVLAAGIGDDVIGWILLALCVALVNSTSGLSALWALLCTVGWALLLVFAIRPCFVWCLRKTGSLQNGPTQGVVALTVMLVLISAWVTTVVGVHAVFGAFLVGLICPHDGGFAIKLTEKIEDFISVIFLPLYFALSGLSTNLSLLNDGITWAYVVAIIALAFSCKIIGATLAARACKLLWRESLTIGVLMSCKGLVEIIVLNIGLQARILNQKTFTMFVVMALVTTVATTPLAKLLYPAWYQKKVESWRRGEIDWDGNPRVLSTTDSAERLNSFKIRRLLVYLRLDSLPGLFTLIDLLSAADRDESHKRKRTSSSTDGGATTAAEDDTGETRPRVSSAGNTDAVRPHHRHHQHVPLEVHGVRLLELTERTSSVMRAAEGDDVYPQHEPVLNVFRTFSRLHDVAAAGRIAVVAIESYAQTLASQAADVAADFVLIPWSESGSLAEDQFVPPAAGDPADRFAGNLQLGFVQKALREASETCSVGILVNNGLGGDAAPHAMNPQRPSLKRNVSGWSMASRREAPVLPLADKSHRIFLPFFGGVDDRVALAFVFQLARNPLVSATIVHFSGLSDDGDAPPPTPTSAPEKTTAPAAAAAAAAAVAPKKTEPAVGSQVVEDATPRDVALLSTLRSPAVPSEVAGRITVSEVPSGSGAFGDAVGQALARAREAVGLAKNSGDVVVVGRRHVRLGDAPAGESAAAAAATASPASELGKTVGVVGEQMVLAGLKASVLVVQAGGKAMEL